jgi:hypothetical protein
MKLTIAHDTKSFDVNDKDVLLLELDLNRSEYGHEWGHIGEYLYNFYAKEEVLHQINPRLEVTEVQYFFLLELHKPST